MREPLTAGAGTKRAERTARWRGTLALIGRDVTRAGRPEDERMGSLRQSRQARWRRSACVYNGKQARVTTKLREVYMFQHMFLQTHEGMLKVSVTRGAEQHSPVLFVTHSDDFFPFYLQAETWDTSPIWQQWIQFDSVLTWSENEPHGKWIPQT